MRDYECVCMNGYVGKNCTEVRANTILDSKWNEEVFGFVFIMCVFILLFHINFFTKIYKKEKEKVNC